MSRQAVPMVFPTLGLLRKRPAVVDKEVYPISTWQGFKKLCQSKARIAQALAPQWR